MWHDGIIHKIKHNGISGNLFNLYFLRNRKQRVILNGQKFGGQVSILGPLLFLIYINDLPDNIQCNPKLFADGMSLFSTVGVPERTANNLNNKFKINK